MHEIMNKRKIDPVVLEKKEVRKLQKYIYAA
jgi:hypothetical protein